MVVMLVSIVLFSVINLIHSLQLPRATGNSALVAGISKNHSTLSQERERLVF